MKPQGLPRPRPGSAPQTARVAETGTGLVTATIAQQEGSREPRTGPLAPDPRPDVLPVDPRRRRACGPPGARRGDDPVLGSDPGAGPRELGGLTRLAPAQEQCARPLRRREADEHSRCCT